MRSATLEHAPPGRREAGRPQDGPIVAMLRAGDPAGADRLLAAYGRMILSWAKGEGSEAEDVLQEVLMRVWRARERLDPGTTLPTFLKTLTQNVIRDRWRASGRRPIVLSGLEPPRTDRADPLAGQRSRIAVEQVLSELAPRERDVLRMLYVSDLTLAEVADRLGVSEEAAKSLAARARRRLRTRIEQTVGGAAAALHLLVGRAAEAATAVLQPVAAGVAAVAVAAAFSSVPNGTTPDAGAVPSPQTPSAIVQPVDLLTADEALVRVVEPRVSEQAEPRAGDPAEAQQKASAHKRDEQDEPTEPVPPAAGADNKSGPSGGPDQSGGSPHGQSGGSVQPDGPAHGQSGGSDQPGGSAHGQSGGPDHGNDPASHDPQRGPTHPDRTDPQGRGSENAAGHPTPQHSDGVGRNETNGAGQSSNGGERHDGNTGAGHQPPGSSR